MIRTVLISSCAGMLCFGCIAQIAGNGKTDMYAAPMAFESMNYLAPWTETEMVTLENGQYREPVRAVSASSREVRLSTWQVVGRVDGQGWAWSS